MDIMTSFSDPHSNSAPIEPEPSGEESVIAWETSLLPLGTKGEKVAALEFLAGSGLPVPAWFLALPEAFLSGTRPPQRGEFLQSHDPTKAKYFAQRNTLSPKALEEIAGAVNQLLRSTQERGSDREAYFAVRVSLAPGEAARHLTNIEPLPYLRADDVPGALLRVWQSVYSEEALHKRLAAGMPLVMYPPALIVQRMVRADVSGLAYGGDPLTGRRGTTVIAAVYGLGTSIVSGESDADTYEITRERAVVRRDIACKQVAHVLDRDEGYGVTARLIPVAQQELPLLTDAQVAALSDLTGQVGDLYHRPQEVEWALEAGRFWLLGSRTAPALPRLADPDAPSIRWQRERIAETYPGTLTALSYTLAKAMLQGEFHALQRAAGLSEADVSAQGRVAARLVGQIDGAIYLNTDALRDLLAGLPQPEWQRAQISASLGIDTASTIAPISGILNGETPEPSGKSEAFDVVHLDVLGNSRVFSALQAQSARHEAIHRGFSDRLNQALEKLEQPLPLRQLRLDELMSHVHTIRGHIVDNWDAPTANQILTSALSGLLGQLTAAWCEDTQGELLRNLQLNPGEMPGTAAERSIHRIADGVLASELIELFRHGALSLIRSTLSLDAHTSIRVELAEYLSAWGDVIPEGLKVEAQTLRENPLPLYRQIGLAASPGAGMVTPKNLLPSHCVTADQADTAKSARARAERYFSDRTMRRRYFDKVYALARQHRRCQELYEFDRVRVFAALRALLLEVGKRLYAVNALETSAQIAHLELDEVIGFIEGTASCTDLKSLVEVRSRQYASWSEKAATLAPPSSVTLPNILPVGIAASFRTLVLATARILP